ncbi:uncharacterized protein LOC21396027 [Morus notabilis]|uniref:uncharacterized protein LOC21396027 n=1 Tax=Morus notabilis TaxID=981085 RepID=UPI000CED3106|nr:uncharacterized protein LOC21396027 [Morus notabilis]
MLVANSFDLWQKDAFFSAAEEVQESADIMESAYRTWVRERRERPSLDNLDELSRELQTALGTAKWQLEEFERAVRLSYGHRSDDNSTARHSQFIAAIGSQISRVEATLRESFLEEGKLPLRWVNLDEEERDDLAAFLSGTPQITQSAKDECVDVRPSTKSSSEESHFWSRDTDLHSSAASKRNTLDEIVCVKDESPMHKNVNYAMELEGKEILGSRDDIIGQADRTTNSRRTWSTPNFGALKIVIADEDDVQRNKSISGLENTPKEKGSKFVFWKKRCGELSRTTGTVNLFNQLFSRVSGSQRQLHNPPRMQYGCSLQVTLALMLTIFLIVPFLLFSN